MDARPSVVFPETIYLNETQQQYFLNNFYSFVFPSSDLVCEGTSDPTPSIDKCTDGSNLDHTENELAEAVAQHFGVSFSAVEPMIRS